MNSFVVGFLSFPSFSFSPFEDEERKGTEKEITFF